MIKIKSKFFKNLNSIAISAGLFGLFSYSNPVKSETPALCKDVLTQTTTQKNIFSQNTGEARTALASSDYYCLGSPDKFELTIYEMGLCTQTPISGSPKAFSKVNCVTTMASAGTTADLAGKTVTLPPATGRPTNATYTHAYIVILNTFGLRGSISLDGTVYCSTNTGEVDDSANCVASNHVEELDDFGDGPGGDPWEADFGPETMPTGGKVSAILTDSDLVRADDNEDVSRLIGVFETNAGSPVVINDSVNGVEVELQVSDGGYGIAFNGSSGVPVDFGSAPFKPVFNTF